MLLSCALLCHCGAASLSFVSCIFHRHHVCLCLYTKKQVIISYYHKLEKFCSCNITVCVHVLCECGYICTSNHIISSSAPSVKFSCYIFKWIIVTYSRFLQLMGKIVCVCVCVCVCMCVCVFVFVVLEMVCGSWYIL